MLFTEAVSDFLLPSLVGETTCCSKDSEGTITMAEKPISGERTKNIEVRHHYIKELVEPRVISGQCTASRSQHADILRKPLRLEAFRKYRAFLMNLLS